MKEKTSSADKDVLSYLSQNHKGNKSSSAWGGWSHPLLNILGLCLFSQLKAVSQSWQTAFCYNTLDRKRYCKHGWSRATSSITEEVRSMRISVELDVLSASLSCPDSSSLSASGGQQRSGRPARLSANPKQHGAVSLIETKLRGKQTGGDVWHEQAELPMLSMKTQTDTVDGWCLYQRRRGMLNSRTCGGEKKEVLSLTERWQWNWGSSDTDKERSHFTKTALFTVNPVICHQNLLLPSCHRIRSHRRLLKAEVIRLCQRCQLRFLWRNMRNAFPFTGKTFGCHHTGDPCFGLRCCCAPKAVRHLLLLRQLLLVAIVQRGAMETWQAKESLFTPKRLSLP